MLPKVMTYEPHRYGFSDRQLSQNYLLKGLPRKPNPNMSIEKGYRTKAFSCKKSILEIIAKKSCAVRTVHYKYKSMS